MKKIVIVCLASLLVLTAAMTGMAKVNLNYFTHTSISVEGLQPGEYEQKIIDEFEALYPEVNIELEVVPYAGDQGKLELQIAAGTPPDILATDIPKLVAYVDAELLLDFDDVIDKANFLDFAVEASSVNGKMYYYPMGVRVGSFMVNKTLAKEVGVLDLLPLDKPGRVWTTAEFEKFLKAVNDSDKGIYAWCMNFADTAAHGHLHMQLIAGFGGEIFEFKDGKYKCVVNSPEVKEAINFYLDMYMKYPKAIPQGAENVTINDLDNMFSSQGKLITNPGSVNQVIRERTGAGNVGFNISLFPYPAKEGVKPGVPSEWCGFMVFDNGDAEKGKYAKLFVKYFVDNAPDLTGANFNSSPVQKDMPIPLAFQKYADDPEIKYALNEATQFAKDLGNACPVMTQFKELFQIHMQGVLIGAITVDECLRMVEDKTNLLLDEFYEE